MSRNPRALGLYGGHMASAFSSWFGRSCVVDEAGDPLVVYHGTSLDISVFQAMGGQGKTFDTGAFFSDNPKAAQSYASAAGGNVMPVYLSMIDPVVIDACGANWDAIGQKAKVFMPARSSGSVRSRSRTVTVKTIFKGEWDYPDDTASTDDLARWARRAGYSGLVIKNVKDRGPSGVFSDVEIAAPSTVYVAFRPEQIKSAIGNCGAFCPRKPDISMSYGNSYRERMR
jgi:hypothetical protein